MQELQNQKQKDAIEYRLTAAKMTRQEAIETANPVKASHDMGVDGKKLMAGMDAAVAGGRGLPFAYSRKQDTVQEVAKAQQASFMLSEEHTARVIEKVLPAYARAFSKIKNRPLFLK